ncbi:MAG TPA: DUF996 domain-containing protein [Candidatus Acidoferrales bacterium]|nr:DUF996 domain-containing protein [Candidatus Acidoferrales bacterium]
MTPESNKILGGIGAILMFIGFIPLGEPSTGIIALIGLILVLVALHGFASYYKESAIFNNSIYGIIAAIVGAVIAGIVVVVSVLTNLKNFLYKIYPGWNGDWSKLSGLTPTTSNITWSTVQPLLEGLILALVVLWIFIIIATFFARRSLKTLSAKTSVGLFSTAGQLLFIGAFLTIILIGFLLMWIAVLLAAIAFFQIKSQPEQPAPTMAPPAPTPTPV